MPFVGTLDGVTVTPEEVDDGTVMECPRCDDRLLPRSSHYREGNFVARHFYHPNSSGGCSGESEVHLRMKSIALSKLKETYPDHDVVGTEVQIGDRRADVCLEFEEPHPRLGYGVVVEVQWRNENKSIRATTRDFLRSGWSVYWVDEDDFQGRNVELGTPVSVFPTMVPGRKDVADVDHFEFDYSEPTMDVIFPNELLQSLKSELWQTWSFWKTGEWDTRYELKSNNAPRRCAKCSESAKYWVSNVEFSGFVCSHHSVRPDS